MRALFIFLSFSLLTNSAFCQDIEYRESLDQMPTKMKTRQLVKQASLSVAVCSGATVAVVLAAIADSIPLLSIWADSAADKYTEGTNINYDYFDQNSLGFVLGSALSLPVDVITMAFDALPDGKIDDGKVDESYSEIFEMARSSHASTKALYQFFSQEDALCRTSVRRFNEARKSLIDNDED